MSIQGRIEALKRLESGKREAELKAAFGRELKRQLPAFIVLFYSTAGAPDRTILGNGRQTNWEFKHATPEYDSPGRQELICMRMATAGHCRYVIWWEAKGTRETLIVHPRVVATSESWHPVAADAWCQGFDMRWLVEQVRKAHGA